MIDGKKKVFLCPVCGRVTQSDNGNQPLFCSHCNGTRLQIKPQVITKEMSNVCAS